MKIPLLLVLNRVLLVCLMGLAILAVLQLPVASTFLFGKIIVIALFVFLPLFFLIVGFLRNRVGFCFVAVTWIMFPPLLASMVGLVVSRVPLIERLQELAFWMLVPIILTIAWLRSSHVKQYYTEQKGAAQ